MRIANSRARGLLFSDLRVEKIAASRIYDQFLYRPKIHKIDGNRARGSLPSGHRFVKIAKNGARKFPFFQVSISPKIGKKRERGLLLSGIKFVRIAKNGAIRSLFSA